MLFFATHPRLSQDLGLTRPEYYMEMGLSLDFTYWNSHDLILFPSNEETH